MSTYCGQNQFVEMIRHRFHLRPVFSNAITRVRNLLSASVLHPVRLRSVVASSGDSAEFTRVSQRYRLLFENLEYVVFTLNPQGLITFISPAIERLSGYKPQEVEGQPFAYFVCPDDLPDLQASFQKTCAGQLQPYEFRSLAKNGSLHWVRSSCCPRFDNDGRILELAGIMSDITEHRRTEEALRRSEATLAQAGQMAHFGAWDIEISNYEDINANPLRWSDEVYRIFGYEPGEVEVCNELFLERVHPEDRQRVMNAVAHALKEKSPYTLEHRIITPTGRERIVLEHAELMCDEHGRPARIIGAVQDVTDRKQAEAALIRSEKLASVGRMAATVAHEINNPLAAVMNVLFLARGNPDVPAPVRRYMDLADEELRRISHISNQALGFYRESSIPTVVSLDALIDSVVDLLKNKIKARHVRLEKQFERQLQVVGVTGELRQLFSNLLANSLDAVAEHGGITLRVSAAPWAKNGRHWMRVTVADNGAGIPADALPHIFEPLFTTKGSVGTGLGLWVSKQIIDKHAGSIRVHSRISGPRRGTTFSVVLPAEAVPSAALGNYCSTHNC
jgi:PAS domain S-box-containing protein